MTRRCSHCSNNGHNSRTCPNRGLKLFGVRITDGSIRKSASMGNLTHYTGSGSLNGLYGGGGADLDSPGDCRDHNAAVDGYGSEDFVAGSSSGRERKKGVPWTEEEHRMFLLGLQKLGKGDWRGISKSYVISRTPTQVASHAQKYFIRHSNLSRRKRRSSLFDITADDSANTPMTSSHDHHLGNPSQQETQPINKPSTIPTFEEGKCESMDSANSNNTDPPTKPPAEPTHQILDGSHYSYPILFSAYIPIAIPYWPRSGPGSGFGPGFESGFGLGLMARPETHVVHKPTAIHSKTPVNVDEFVGMSKLSLGESIGEGESTALGFSQQSAFHANNPSSRSSAMSSSHSPIHAV